MTRFLLLAALPQEHGPFRRLSGSWRLISRRPFREYVRLDPTRELRLVETGMGRSGLGPVLDRWREEPPPLAVISMGFCGSIKSSFPVGQVLLGTSFGSIDGPLGGPVSHAGHLNPSPEIEEFCSRFGVRPARVLTLHQPAAKRVLWKHYPWPGLVTDMESSHIARFAKEMNLPFLCFRSVSDASAHEIDFDLKEISDSHGRVRIARVLQLVGRKPALARSFYDSWRRSRTAANTLGRVLRAFLDGPPPKLRRMIEGCHLSRN